MKTQNNMSGEIRKEVSYEDFSKVFKVFAEYPFCESWDEEEVRKEYDSIYQKNGNIYGYFVDGECVSILTMYPIIRGEHYVEFNEKDKVMYLSDIATISTFRRRGIGTQLIELAFRHCKDLGYNYMYLRTSEKDMQFLKMVGFERIYDVCQEVEKKRVDGRTKKDLRVFMRTRL